MLWSAAPPMYSLFQWINSLLDQLMALAHLFKAWLFSSAEKLYVLRLTFKLSPSLGLQDWYLAWKVKVKHLQFLGLWCYYCKSRLCFVPTGNKLQSAGFPASVQFGGFFNFLFSIISITFVFRSARLHIGGSFLILPPPQMLNNFSDLEVGFHSVLLIEPSVNISTKKTPALLKNSHQCHRRIIFGFPKEPFSEEFLKEPFSSVKNILII